MGDYSGIGDAMVGLAVVGAFAVPVAICTTIALVLSLIGFGTAAIVVGCVGIIAGIVCAAWVTIQA